MAQAERINQTAAKKFQENCPQHQRRAVKTQRRHQHAAGAVERMKPGHTGAPQQLHGDVAREERHRNAAEQRHHRLR